MNFRSAPSVSVLRRLFLPQNCVSCGDLGSWWCGECDAVLRASLGGVEQIDGVTTSCAVRYGDVVRDLILGYKVGLITAVAPVLGALVRRAVVAHPLLAPDVVCVPVPATTRSWLKRGFDPVTLMLAETDLPVRCALAWRRPTRPQKFLRRDERARNVTAALRARRLPGRVLVVDDVVTTGATIRASVAALRSAGVTVVGAACVARVTS